MSEPTWLNALGFFVLGLALLGIELFLPSFGVLTVAAIVSFGFALYWAFAVHAVLGWSLVGVLAVLAAFSPRLVMAAWRRTAIVLDGPQSPQGDNEATHKTSSFLLGKTGLAITPLRPIGRVEIEGKAYEVRTENAFVPVGGQVQVDAVESGQIRVIPL